HARWHDAAERTSASGCAFTRNFSSLGKTYEVTEGYRRRAPPIKPQNCRSCPAEEHFVDRHVERSGTRRRIVKYNQFGKHSFRFPQEFSRLRRSGRAQR